MRHGSLFSGIGGFDLAAEWMGWENVFHCEWNDFGQKVLNHYWPKAISYHDITQTDFTIHKGQIDILTGGFPCQPYSSAGKRLGKEDDRHLWPEMLRAIREIQPTWVVGENVRGLINWNGGMVFDEVQADLEAEGYEVWPFLLPACSVNAPHRRDRIWFVAYASQFRHRGRREYSMSDQSEKWEMDKDKQQYGNGVRSEVEGRSGTSADTSNKGLQGGKVKGSTKGSGEERNKQPSRSFQPGWKEFPTKPPVCGGDDGLSSKLVGITVSKHRKESIKAYGNAVVPQVVYQIFKTIQAYKEKQLPLHKQ